MTVKTVKEPQDRAPKSVLEQKKEELLSLLEPIAEEAEMESPKSVGKWKDCVHSQVLRIKEEDSYLGEDKMANCGGGGVYHDHSKHGDVQDNHRCYRKHHRVDVTLLARPILPCSPLSGKTTTTFKALH